MPLLSTLASSILRFPVASYITRQRDRLVPIAIPLSPALTRRMTAYFASADLDRVRIVQRDPLPISAPPFSRTVRKLGLDYPSLATTAGITFDHIVAVRAEVTPSLLLHELVHVVQYRLLGVSAFAHLYTRGFLSQGAYESIPLEVCAYELEHRFGASLSPFDVEAEVSRWISQGWY